MANYASLINLIDQYITTNGQGDITGAILNNTLKAVVNALGAGYQFKGVATPSTDPGTPDYKAFYFASEAGTYTNFNGLILQAGLNILTWDTQWSVDSITTTTNVIQKPTPNNTNAVESNGIFFDTNNKTTQILGHILNNPDGLSQVTMTVSDPQKLLSATTGMLITASSYAGYSTTDYIPVTPKDNQYVCYFQGTPNNPAFASMVVYDADHLPLFIVNSYLIQSPIVTGKYLILDLPWNAAYVRFSYDNGHTTSLYALPKTRYDAIQREVETAVGFSTILPLIETINERYVNAAGQLAGGSAVYHVMKYSLSGQKYVFFQSNASGNSAVYAYTIHDANGNVLDHASVNILTKRLFFIPVPDGATYLYVGDTDFSVSGIEAPGDMLQSLADVIKTVTDIVSTTVEYRNLIASEIVPNSFVYKGSLNGGGASWNVSRYNIAGLTSVLHLYSDAPVNESVYAYTILDADGNKINWATVPVVTQREFRIDLSTIEGGITLYVGNARYAQVMQAGQLPVLQQRVENLENKVNKWGPSEFTANNNILWLGTSIPEGAEYPAKASAKCGYACINNAYGGSCLCWPSTKPSTVNNYSGRCLTATVAELESRYRADVTAGTITEATLNAWKAKSYENSVLPYINGQNAVQVSMIVLDHGFNDRVGIHSLMQSPNSIDWTSRDRSNFVGAFNYLVDKIQEINPTIKIVISGYFQNTITFSDYYSKDICDMLELIAEHFNFSIMKAWEHSQIGQFYIAGSSNYIANFNSTYGTSYAKWNADTDGNITSMQIYCPDRVHPHSDLTGNCNRRLNAIYSKLLADLI